MPGRRHANPAQQAPAPPAGGGAAPRDAQDRIGNAAIQERLNQSRIGTKVSGDSGKVSDMGQASSGAFIEAVNRSAAGTGFEVAEQLGESMSRGGVGLTALLAPLSHYLGDDRVTESDAEHLSDSVIKGGFDMLGAYTGIDAASQALAGRGGIQPSGLAGVVGAFDGFLDGDNPLKMVTETAANIDPATLASKSISGGVDAARVLQTFGSGRHAEAFRASDQLEENAINGNYSVLAQAGTMFAGLAAGDSRVTDMLIDDKAASGERGAFLKLSNDLGDGMYEAFHDAPKSGAELDQEIAMEDALVGGPEQRREERARIRARGEAKQGRQEHERREQAAREAHEAQTRKMEEDAQGRELAARIAELNDRVMGDWHDHQAELALKKKK